MYVLTCKHAYPQCILFPLSRLNLDPKPLAMLFSCSLLPRSLYALQALKSAQLNSHVTIQNLEIQPRSKLELRF